MGKKNGRAETPDSLTVAISEKTTKNESSVSHQ
jgi:hypothetical protein